MLYSHINTIMIVNSPMAFLSTRIHYFFAFNDYLSEVGNAHRSTTSGIWLHTFNDNLLGWTLFHCNYRRAIVDIYYLFCIIQGICIQQYVGRTVLLVLLRAALSWYECNINTIKRKKYNFYWGIICNLCLRLK